MLRAISTHVFVKERLHPGLLDQLVRGGAQAIEIFGARQHFDYANRKQHVLEIAGWFKDHPDVALHSLHAPMFSDYDWGRSGGPPVNIASIDRATRVDAMDEVKRALEVAEHVPFRYLIQHLGVSGETFGEKKFEAAMTSVEHLRAFAKPLGVSILLENIPNELATPERLTEFIRVSHMDGVGVCLDVGHAHMMSDVAQAFEILKDHIRSTHIHDNKKDQDAHLWPGDGSIHWEETMNLLRSSPHRPPLMLEIKEDEQKKDVVAEMSAAYKKLGV